MAGKTPMRRAGRGLLRVAAVALVVGFAGPVAIARAELVIDSPAGGSIVGRTPTFAGTTTGLEPVVKIVIFNRGQSQEVAGTETLVSKGSWRSGGSITLPSGEYEAEALQGFETSVVVFTVNASSPEVTLNAPQSPSENTTPSFTGTTNQTTQVVVHIDKAGAGEVSKATASPPAANGPPAPRAPRWHPAITRPRPTSRARPRSKEILKAKARRSLSP